MIRCVFVLLILLPTASPSRGEDDGDRCRRVRVALALAADTPARASARPSLDWFAASCGCGDCGKEKAPAPQSPQPKVRRVELHGLWYDRHPDGRLDYCQPCNKGKAPVGDRIGYQEALACVRAGVRVVLAVGVKPLDDSHFYGVPVYAVGDPPKGAEPGHYQTTMQDGKPAWFRSGSDQWTPAPARAAPGVAAPRPFRRTSAGHDPDHQCDRCGASQYVVSGFNADGTHNHRCPACGNVWRH